MTEPVWIAIITFIASPVVVGLLARRGIIHEFTSRVGNTDSKGNVVEMLEKILAGQTGQDARLARLETRDLIGEEVRRDHETRIKAIEDRHRRLDQYA